MDTCPAFKQFLADTVGPENVDQVRDFFAAKPCPAESFEFQAYTVSMSQKHQEGISVTVSARNKAEALMVALNDSRAKAKFIECPRFIEIDETRRFSVLIVPK